MWRYSTRSAKKLSRSISSPSGRVSPEKLNLSASNVKDQTSWSRASRIFAFFSFLPPASAAFASAAVCTCTATTAGCSIATITGFDAYPFLKKGPPSVGGCFFLGCPFPCRLLPRRFRSRLLFLGCTYLVGSDLSGSDVDGSSSDVLSLSAFHRRLLPAALPFLPGGELLSLLHREVGKSAWRRARLCRGIPLPHGRTDSHLLGQAGRTQGQIFQIAKSLTNGEEFC